MDLLRSLLLIPARDTSARKAARESHADALVLDLADGTSPSEAEATRAAAREATAELRADGRPLWIRAHPTSTLLTKTDVRATLSDAVTGYVLPDALSANHVRYFEALLRDAEAAAGLKSGTVRVIAVIESAEGLLNAREIARATARLAALALDGAGYCADLGIENGRDGHAMQHPRGHVAVCARAANVLALDTPYLNPRETQGLLADATMARSLGMHGKFLIKPDQAVTVNAVFRPSAEEVAYARRLDAAHREAIERGDEFGHIDGRIIDASRARRARRLVELATAIEAREAQAAV
jgi:citrate lyase subunit beta/citryl-CoA lyase